MVRDVAADTNESDSQSPLVDQRQFAGQMAPCSSQVVYKFLLAIIDRLAETQYLSVIFVVASRQVFGEEIKDGLSCEIAFAPCLQQLQVRLKFPVRQLYDHRADM